LNKAKEFLRSWLSKREPWFFEHSKVTKLFSKLYGFEVNAINIWFLVFGKAEISDSTRRHEKTHYIQQWEMLFVGQWLAYAYYYFKGWILTKDRKQAYRDNPFEREARAFGAEEEKFETRRFWNWRFYR